MDAPFRDFAAVVPAIAVAAASQIAAGALTTAARLLDEHGDLATLAARHAASRTVHITDELNNRFTRSAFVAASSSAYTAQQTAEAVSAVASTLAAAAQAAVQCATARAQNAVRQQASNWQQYADNQAAAANQRMQDAIHTVSATFPAASEWPADFGSSNTQAATSDSQSMHSARTPAVPTAPAPAPTAAPVVPAPHIHVDNSSAVQSVGTSRAAVPAPVVGRTRRVDSNSSISSISSNSRLSPISLSPISLSPINLSPISLSPMHEQQVGADLAASQAALAAAQQQLVVKELVGTIFRSVERTAAHEEAARLSQQLQECRTDLHAARLQLQAAAEAVAAVPGQIMQLVQEQVQQALQDKVHLGISTLPANQATVAATSESDAAGASVASYAGSDQPCPSPAAAGVSDAAAHQEPPFETADSAASSNDGECGNAESNEDSSDLSCDFLMVDMPSAAEGVAGEAELQANAMAHACASQ